MHEVGPVRGQADYRVAACGHPDYGRIDGAAGLRPLAPPHAGRCHAGAMGRFDLLPAAGAMAIASCFVLDSALAVVVVIRLGQLKGRDHSRDPASVTAIRLFGRLFASAG